MYANDSVFLLLAFLVVLSALAVGLMVAIGPAWGLAIIVAWLALVVAVGAVAMRRGWM